MMLPHTRLPLTQQKITTQALALEISMNLEASPIIHTHAGVQNIQHQLANLTLELQDVNRGKETRLEVWCTKCKAEGHYKDQCLMFRDYLGSGANNRVNPGSSLWCAISREAGQHHYEDFYLLKLHEGSKEAILQLL